MTDLDERLFSCHLTPGYTESEWREIWTHLLGTLVAKLGQPIDIGEIRITPDCLSGDIRSETSTTGLSWFGILSATVVGKREATEVEATLFLRGFGKRLVAADGNAYLWLIYERQPNGTYAWRDPQWMKDDLGEYEHWD